MTAPAAVAAPPALELTDLEVAYRVRGIWRPVLRGVTFAIAEGESYGLVGRAAPRRLCADTDRALCAGGDGLGGHVSPP